MITRLHCPDKQKAGCNNIKALLGSLAATLDSLRHTSMALEVLRHISHTLMACNRT